MTKNIQTIFLGAVLATSITLHSNAFASDQNIQPQPVQDNKTQKYISDTALMLGGARFCKVEMDLVEEFIILAEGRLNALAVDEYEKVTNMIDFKNLAAAASGKPPKAGCTKFMRHFQDALRHTY